MEKNAEALYIPTNIATRFEFLPGLGISEAALGIAAGAGVALLSYAFLSFYSSIAIRRAAEVTTFLRFSAWGQHAVFLEKHFKKGMPVTLIGELRNDSYEKNGVKVQTVYLLVEKVAFVPQNKNEGGTE